MHIAARQINADSLVELLDEAREASGAGLRLIVSGPPVPLDPGVELAAYRIVQEGLTNARRHAPGAAVDVELRFTEAAVRLRIRDNGPGPPPLAYPGGHGLTGMRERAAAAGGELQTGAAPGGGFLMDVRMPVTDGIEATRQLTGPGPDGNPGPRILILTTFDLDHYVYDALCAGASGFLLKDVTAERLFDAAALVPRSRRPCLLPR